MPEHSSTQPPARVLPPNPNLEQLRKQAKDLLENIRAGYPAALGEVHRWELHPDPATFALQDAQRILARAYGFTSWSSLKAFVDGANIRRLAAAVQNGDLAEVRSLLHARPELVHVDLHESDEHRALHFAVLRRDAPMIRLLMEAGADARKGIFPHRDATSAYALARDREYADVLAIIDAEEQARRAELSCPNATVSASQDRITTAITHGDTSAAIALLADDPTLIQACDRYGGTPLHAAAEAGDLSLIEWLLARRAPIHKPDVAGLTALDRAALALHPGNDPATGFPAIARHLLAAGAQFTLRAAVALDDSARVHELLASDPSPLRVIERSGGLLALAVKHRHPAMVRLLLDFGADPDERTLLSELEEPTASWGFPLWHAARANHLEISQMLLDRGADPNANVYASGWPLSNAWNHRDPAVKNLLLARGATPQPYMLSENHDVAAARQLLAKGSTEELARELAWSAADHGCPAILELALPHLTWPPNDPRWHWILIQPPRGAPGDDSQIEKHLRALELILQRGVSPAITRFGQTVLHFVAAYHGPVSGPARARFASLLLDFHAPLDVRDDLLQSTPLGWACRWDRRELAELLLARGAPVNEPAAASWATPLAWSRKMHRPAIEQLLLTHLARSPSVS